jgi:hypothetical protein
VFRRFCSGTPVKPDRMREFATKHVIAITGNVSSTSPELSIAQLCAQDAIHPKFASISLERVT